MTGMLPAAPLLLEVVRERDELRALAPEWEALADSLPLRLPFHSPSWHLRWFDSFAQSRQAVRDSLEVRVLRRTSGELLAVAPMMLTERPSVGPLRIRMLQFTGADPNLTEVRGVICRPADERDVFRTLLGALRRESDRWDLLQWSGLRAGGEGEALVLAERGAEPGLERPDYLLALPASWDAFRGGLSRNIKESLRKCQNAPRRDGVELRGEVIAGAPGLEPALERLYAMHAARAQVETGVHHGDVFSQTAARRFFTGLARELAAKGAFRVYQLRHGDKVVAARAAFLLGDTSYLYYSGYDLDYSRYSVMTSCVAFAIRHAIESGLATVNLSTGNDVSKTRWGPRELIFREALWVSPGAHGGLARRAHRLLETARTSQALHASPLGRLLALGARRND